MITRSITLASVFALSLALAGCSVFGAKAAPEPEFTQISKEAPFEIREYPELVLVKTSMTTEEDDAFMRLFRYISGANEGEREIAMTAPVLENPTGTEIAMTAPVLQNSALGEPTEMAFILTADFTADTAPIPTDPAVKLGVIPSRRVAVVTFNGRANAEDFADNRDKLQAWMKAGGLTAAGPAELAQYNPPWTVPALRRNEVLIPLAE